MKGQYESLSYKSFTTADFGQQALSLSLELQGGSESEVVQDTGSF